MHEFTCILVIKWIFLKTMCVCVCVCVCVCLEFIKFVREYLFLMFNSCGACISYECI